MRFLACFPGRRGEISIMEDRATGARSYYEANVFQSHAMPNGISLFAYVHLMERQLRRAKDVLLLGCAGGSLATMLHRQGKRVTVIDDNPLSFNIARDFFGMPNDVSCIIEDFHEFITKAKRRYDAIGIDIGGPNFSFKEEFDASTCRAIRTRLAPKGQIAMNMIAMHDADLLPDRILAMLTENDLSSWIYDQPGEPNRNVVLLAIAHTCRPYLAPPFDIGDINIELIDWRLRHQRLYFDALAKPHEAFARADEQSPESRR